MSLVLNQVLNLSQWMHNSEEGLSSFESENYAEDEYDIVSCSHSMDST